MGCLCSKGAYPTTYEDIAGSKKIALESPGRLGCRFAGIKFAHDGGENSKRHRGSGKLVLEVDFGDGKPVDLACLVDPKTLEPENEYVSAQRFISDHFELIDNNYLEPIARKLRSRAEPVLATIKNLTAAVDAAF